LTVDYDITLNNVDFLLTPNRHQPVMIKSRWTTHSVPQVRNANGTLAG
jgi:hypothetical protein